MFVWIAARSDLARDGTGRTTVSKSLLYTKSVIADLCSGAGVAVAPALTINSSPQEWSSALRRHNSKILGLALVRRCEDQTTIDKGRFLLYPVWILENEMHIYLTKVV